MSSSSDLVSEGKCPHCEKEVYSPSLSPTGEFAHVLAVGLHAAKCSKNPNYKESEMTKYIREVLDLD
jgi:hypothetical protein